MDSTTPAVQPQTINGIIQNDRDKNRVPVHSFDPDDTPQQKAAAAGQGADQLKSVIQPSTSPPDAKELTVDVGEPQVIPTITIDDADSADDKPDPVTANQPPSPQHPHPQPGQQPDQPQPLPGALPVVPAPAIPDWYKVGWRAVSGIDDPAPPEGEVRDKTILDTFLKEQLYGEWYHNAALIVFTVFFTHFLTRFHFGWGWLFIILAFCNTYYTTSIARFRQRARDDIQRELVKTRLLSEHESAEWLNHFLDRFWLIYEPILSKTIISSVDQILSTNCPSFLESLRLTTFTLGTKAPRIDRVRTFPTTADDIVMMDWGISFTPNDVSDLTQKQAQRAVNPKVVLSVRLGKSIASATMPILLEDISFTGMLRVRMKLMSNFPHIQVVDLTFMEKPVIDYVLKPLGGETFGFDVANIPGLSSFIREMAHSILGPMMYDPNVFTLNLEQILSGEPLDTAVGVLQVNVRAARGIRGSKIGGGTPDPFVSLSVNGRAECARTHYKNSTNNPSWHETKFILVKSLQETLNLNIMDFNDHRKNTHIGTVDFSLADLMEDASQESVERAILKDGKDKGMLRFDVNFHPVLKPQADASGVTPALPETSVGIVRLTVHQAKELDSSKSTSNDLNPFAKVQLGPKTIHMTPKYKHTTNPVWESSTEFLCSDKASSVITVKVIDDRDFLKDPVVGYLRIRLQDLLEAKKQEAGRDWWPLSGCPNGKLRMSAEWKPLNIAGSLHGADQYTPPIGVVRLWLKKAVDVKNVEATLGGKINQSDPYVRAQIRNVTVGRTEVINNNLNPEWDQILYIPIHSAKEIMLLECMDYQHLTKDRLLGYVDLKLCDLAVPSEDPSSEFKYKPLGKLVRQERFKLDNGSFKGELFYEAEFVPAKHIKGLKFESQNHLQHLAQTYDNEGDGGSVVSEDAESSSDEEAQAVPFGITIRSPPTSPTSPTGFTNGKASTNGGSPTDPPERRSTDTAVTARTAETDKAESKHSTHAEQEEDDGVEMTVEELLQQQSGIIVFNVISGHLVRKARLEVLLDDGYWPIFSTVKPPSTNAHWGTIGEGFMKELDFGRVWLRLDLADEGDKDDIIAEWRGDAKAFLQQTLKEPTPFTLRPPSGDDDKISTVIIETRYMPVHITLEPRESVHNQGILQVTLLNGDGIYASDRSGKSDPFAVFSLNGRRVFKSQTKKKTLKPEWNETFEVTVPSRVGSDFVLDLFDWNQIEQAKGIGSGKIDLEHLEPFDSIDQVVALSSEKRGGMGHVNLRLVFRPQIIAKSRKNTSTFSTAGRAMTQIGALPVGAGKGVVHTFTGVFKRDHNKNGSDSEDDATTPVARPATVGSSDLKSKKSIPDLPAGQASKSIGGSTLGAEGLAASHEDEEHTTRIRDGTLKVTILDAKDMSTADVKPYVTIRIGDKERKTKHLHKTEAPEWNESFEFIAGPGQSTLHAWIHDHKTLGKDKLLGSAVIDIWRHLKPGTSSAAEVLSELRDGQGLLRLRLDFDSEKPIIARRGSVSSQLNESRVPASPSRFSLSRLRGSDHD